MKISIEPREPGEGMSLISAALFIAAYSFLAWVVLS